MFYWIKRVYRPEYYHGPTRTKKYFEGWYYKVVSGNRAFAVIPGVSWAPSDPHSFIQTIDGSTGATSYERYDIGEFSFQKGRFAFRVARSEFSLEGMNVHTKAFTAELVFHDLVRWPSTAR